jgi:hypothetical protein
MSNEDILIVNEECVGAKLVPTEYYSNMPRTALLESTVTISPPSWRLVINDLAMVP